MLYNLTPLNPRKIGFWVVPKNASSTFIRLFAQLGCDPVMHHIGLNPILHPMRYVVEHRYIEIGIIVRDPLERWKSGIVQYLQTPRNKNFLDYSAEIDGYKRIYNDPNDLDSWWKHATTNIAIDGHSARQSDMIEYAQQHHVRLKLFPMNNAMPKLELKQNVLNWLKNRKIHGAFGIEPNDIVDYNLSSVQEWRARIFQYIEEHYTPKIEKILKEYYARDIEIYNSLINR